MTLDIVTADTLLPLRHGFFGRAGGASSGVFAGLNCGYGSSDQREVVALNRARVADAMEVASDRLIGVHQVHSADVVTVDAPHDAPRADALVTDRPGLALVILTADCMPVLFADPEAGVIGAAHAGWRGALDGVDDRRADGVKVRAELAGFAHHVVDADVLALRGGRGGSSSSSGFTPIAMARAASPAGVLQAAGADPALQRPLI